MSNSLFSMLGDPGFCKDLDSAVSFQPTDPTWPHSFIQLSSLLTARWRNIHGRDGWMLLCMTHTFLLWVFHCSIAWNMPCTPTSFCLSCHSHPRSPVQVPPFPWSPPWSHYQQGFFLFMILFQPTFFSVFQVPFPQLFIYSSLILCCLCCVPV